MLTLKEALIGKKNISSAKTSMNGKWVSSDTIEVKDLKEGYVLANTKEQYFYVVVDKEYGESFLDIDLHTNTLQYLFIRYDFLTRKYYFADPRDCEKTWPKWNGRYVDKVFTNERDFKKKEDLVNYIHKELSNILTM